MFISTRRPMIIPQAEHARLAVQLAAPGLFLQQTLRMLRLRNNKNTWSSSPTPA
ncbi:MAG: hypothetical protein ACLQUY_00010 [Ktedonobacterales bacterium]